MLHRYLFFGFACLVLHNAQTIASGSSWFIPLPAPASFDLPALALEPVHAAITAEAISPPQLASIPESIVTDALNLLDAQQPVGQTSFEYSFGIGTAEGLAATVHQIEAVPAISYLVDLVSSLVLNVYALTGQYPMHIAIRVDLNTQRMRRAPGTNRALTSEWHDHGDDARYLFVLSRIEETATQVRDASGTPSSIPLGVLYLLPGPVRHRTPPETTKPYRRIQFSLAIAPTDSELH